MASHAEETEELDLVIVGGGISGLCALRTIVSLEKGPLKIALLENQSSIGGVWAQERLYTDLKTNHVLGSYEFSDFPMRPKVHSDLKPGHHIPGNTVHDYLETYVDEFLLRGYIRLGQRVQNVVEHKTGDDDQTSTWELEIEDLSAGTISTIHAKKLIVATGQTSQPYFPERLFKSQDEFERPIFHCVDLHKYESELFNNADGKEKKRVTVFGSAKSAFDAVYTIAETYNTPVDMIIRASGHGPIWMCPALVTPLKKYLEKLMTVRLLTWFSPCIWGDADGYSGVRSFLHSTWLGRKIVDIFWSVIGNDVKTLNKYDSHLETAKLKPWIEPLWVASGLSILNYDRDFFDLVREGKVRIHIANVERLSTGAVHLSTGEFLSSDGIVCCTGWRTTPTINFPPETQKELGFPTAEDPIPVDMIQKADAHILQQLPRLKDQPVFNTEYQPLIQETPSQTLSAAPSHPLRLYHFLIPCTPQLASSRSIAFLGMATTASTMLITQVQALWIAAYFYHPDSLHLPAPDRTEIQWSTALHTQYCIWRYGVGGHGNRRPDFVFDVMPYVDMLLKELGLRQNRKESRLKEWLEAYGVEDYRGLVEEFVERLKRDKKDL
ncbi:flavin-binding monooxygenase-like protein [Talaromyces stipitatus ATCC 10500]|uniref:Flavin-binding monooxygenase-like protein n=1 Tax=Talaromyces stipitatus (strain ATCC 10500 / CBS 375.48 / QM 6759 / NRRL 1006) TaxID=441959 RepID=B8MQP6_TALSN|nr:flavin-binding monooxygenase-like protein [Talaromyces stipitatus ATCC 10500]EED13469.1 flavin-binding monooxygenase-like protein [Talaromyces stipitatus ATCC 10500]